MSCTAPSLAASVQISYVQAGLLAWLHRLLCAFPDRKDPVANGEQAQRIQRRDRGGIAPLFPIILWNETQAPVRIQFCFIIQEGNRKGKAISFFSRSAGRRS